MASLPDWHEPHGKDWRTTRAIAWRDLTVPPGFVFQPSIPWWARWWLSRNDARFRRAAAFHDYALHRLGWSRVAAAAPFAEALQSDGVERFKRLAMVLAVIVHKWR